MAGLRQREKKAMRKSGVFRVLLGADLDRRPGCFSGVREQILGGQLKGRGHVVNGRRSVISEASDVAIQTGEYHLTALGPNGDGEDKGRFVTVWKKVNGEWKAAPDINSTTMPEAQTARQ
jgi:hypothetical protein